VWYRNNEDPLQFTAASRLSEDEILDRVLAQEHITPSDLPPGAAGIQARIAGHDLAPVKYTEDESEMNTIA
jgi:hypothetical protein